MKRFIQKYTGFIRNLRLVHYLYNIWHRKGLKHNKHLYPYFDIEKSVYASISHKDFKDKKAKKPWLDGIVSEKDIQNHPLFCHFSATIEKQILKWNKNGFLILENFLDGETSDAINQEIDSLLEKKEVDFNYTNRKIFNAYQQSYTIRKVIKEKRLLDILNFILDKKVLPFQTINFLKGSEQQAHSDSIHMSTFPNGYLIAAWFALEDITIEQGPLSYFPGSQQLPYLTNADYENTSNNWLLDGDANKKYEAKVKQVIAENNFEKKIFLAKKGDVFVWHANLMHGGEPMLKKELSRKSMVVHYFADNVIAYHEISERPAIFDTELVGEIKDDFYKGQTDILDI
ncbi:MAG TPA: phytanoyl-CoA dioxygenase family protein [Chitinophagales bacterium]|nr:phytanoyl-CoA dioxygenase family protein [Chitinophagales bacterium]